MGSILINDVLVVRSFNNNIVLVRDNGKEKILFQKGIGFAKKLGEIIEKGIKIEKVFVIESEENQRNFNEIVDRVDNKLIGIVEEAIVDITNELGEELNENIHIGLVDHLSFAIKRLKDNEEIQNPFLVEIETLYSKEFDLAYNLVKKIERSLNIDIPDGEVGFIALHIHSARSNGKLSNTIKYSFLGSSVVELVEDRLNIEIDRKSLDYARFLTHIRFAIERVITNNPIKNDLKDIIKAKYRRSYKIAEEARMIISKGLELNVSDDETAYIAMHIERFKESVKK
ncbi:PRD domain-containing protein [Clostridium carnis]